MEKAVHKHCTFPFVFNRRKSFWNDSIFIVWMKYSFKTLQYGNLKTKVYHGLITQSLIMLLSVVT